MPQYIKIAEKVYEKYEVERESDASIQECLNLIIKNIRKELIDTDLKLIFNYIDFIDGFKKPINDNRIGIDVSLVPNHKNKGEFILWLATFIEKNTEGGVKRQQSSKIDQIPFYICQSDPTINLDIRNKHSGERIISYFREDDFPEDLKEI